MNFRQLIQGLEHRVGYHQLPLNPSARDIRTLFDNTPLHQDLMRRLVHAIYRKNACRSLDDPVTRHDTFDAVGPIRHEVIKSQNSDVDLHHLFEELCTAIDAVFAVESRESASRTGQRDEAASAQVIPLDAFRHRRHLKPSA